MTEENTISDEMITQLALEHNRYLSLMIANFNYEATDLIDEFENRVINANIDLNELSLSDRYNILARFKDTNGEYKIPTQVDLIVAINNANLSDKAKLTNYVNILSNKVLTNTDNYTSLAQFIDSIKNIASTDLNNQSLVIFKSYAETLKASGYFWYPESRGGSGVGYIHMEAISNATAKPKPTNGKIAAALISDASSLSIGMIGVAVFGMFTPLGPAVLIGVAAEAAVGSGFTPVRNIYNFIMYMIITDNYVYL